MAISSPRHEEVTAPVRATRRSRRSGMMSASPTVRVTRWTWQRICILVLVFLFIFPFLVMFFTAFKTENDVFSSPPTLWPTEWTWSNFTSAFEQIPFWRYLGNTMLVCVVTVTGTLLSCPLVAYALSKIRWRGSQPLLIVVLATMMLPPQVTMIPIYLMWNRIGAYGTYLPLMIPAFLGTPFLIFMIRQFLMNVPNELIDAGRVDGASEFRIYWSIVLPIARPALVTSAVFQFVWTWTDFLNPLIYLDDSKNYTLSIGLYTFFSEHGVAWGPLMAACVMFTLPAAVIFIMGQRYFMGGVAAGSLK